MKFARCHGVRSKIANNLIKQQFDMEFGNATICLLGIDVEGMVGFV
jgi:hypothetical protein